jgi:hypothetical protein
MWTIDVEAESHREAAEEARRIQDDPESIGHCYQVVNEAGVAQRVDLDEEEVNPNDESSERDWLRSGKDERRNCAPRVPRARLDADRTATPLTRLVGHGREGDCLGPGTTQADALEDIATGKRTPVR